MKRYLIAGLLVWVPLGITIWVLHFLLTSLDQILLVLPESAAAARAVRLRHPRARRRRRVPDPVRHRRRRRQLLRPAADSRVGGGARPHPVREVDLFVGEAGERHAAVRQGQRVSQGAARRVSAARKLDDRVPDRRRRHPASRRASRAITSASTCPRRPIRPAATS